MGLLLLCRVEERIGTREICEHQQASNQGQGRRQRGGRRGLQPPYCLRNKGILLQFSLKFSAINECLVVEEGVHTLAYTTIDPSFTLL
jgi:hypothetical protein